MDRRFLIAALVAAFGCQKPPPRGRAQVVQTVPAAGEVSADDMRGGIRVIFNRPVAPKGAVGRVVRNALEIEPAAPGESRWIDERTLAFFLAQGKKLRPSTRYTIGLSDELVTAPDVAVASWKGVRLVHERIAIEQVSFTGSTRFQPAAPVVMVQASLPVSAETAADACAFYERRPDGSAGARTRAEPAPTEASEGQPRAARLRPRSPLAAGAAYLLRCGPDFRPADGGEGLAKDHDSKFSTYGPATVKRFGPAGKDVSADGVKVEVEFATPMNATDVRQHVKLVGQGDDRKVELAGDGSLTTFAWSGDLTPGGSYEIVVDGGLHDVFGQALGDERRHAFGVGDASARLQMEHGIFVVERGSGRYPIWTRNLSRIHVRCAAVPEARLSAVLTGPANYDAWWDAAPGDATDYGKLGLKLRERDLPTAGNRNHWFDAGLPLAATCGGGPSGVYLLEVSSDEVKDNRWARSRRSLATVTDLGLMAKVGNASSLVWVVHLSSGKPAAGVTVKVRDLAGKVRFTGKTNADGVALAPGAAKLIGVKPRGDAAGEEGEGEWDDYRARRVLVTAQSGDDLAVLDTNWNNGIQVWNFGVDQDRRGGEKRVRGFLHSDRGLYRPGETVHLHGLVRTVDVTGKMTVPAVKRIHLIVEDPRQATLFEEDVRLTSFGGLSRDVVLPAEARLGDYRVRGEIDGQKFSERFSVEEFRARTFEVKVKTPKKDVFLGEKLRFSLTASYLYGAPLREGKVTWNVRRRAHLPMFAGFDEYVFQDFAALAEQGAWWARNEERSFSEPVADGEGALDASGRLSLSASDEVKKLTGPQDYLFEATVEDGTGQAVSVTEVVGGHKANLYLGLHPSEFVQAVDMPFAVQLVGFDAQGKRRAAQVELTLTRRSYDCAPRGDVWEPCRRKDDPEPAIKRQVVLAEAGSAAVERVVVKEPGEYLVRVSGPDGRGGEAASSELIYVIGKGEAFWSGDEGDRMTIIASKQRYRPGETARLVPQAQMAGSLALVTLERDGILSYRIEPHTTSAQAIEVALDGRHAPNVFASVVLVRGRNGEGDRGRPRFKMGMVDLQVESDEKRLTITVETDRPSYQPGETVTARVKVVGADGSPVRAEMALAVADEGVLQIVGFKTPDPLPVMYASWGLGVESATTWNRLLRATNPDLIADDEEGGDSGGDEAGRIRSRFVASAFWAPALVTDAKGVAEASFPAPDNLTAFRVMAVVADAGDRFGAGEKRFTVAKPLQAMPALPRFLSVGDQARAAVVLHNNTAAAIEVAVSLKAKGVDLGGATTQTVKVPAGAARPAVFAVTARREGQATFTFSASGGGERDTVEVKLPVQRPVIEEVRLVADDLTSSRVQHELPPFAATDGAILEVTLDTTGLSRLAGGLGYLVGYPYGCLEQTTSKVVPLVALGELAKAVELKDVSAGKVRGYVETGIAKILRHQHDDGGFGLWIGAPAEAHYTAYALWGLEVARAAGYPVERRAIEAGAGYLKARLAHPVATGASAAEVAAETGDQAFAYYVLAAVGHPDPGGLAQLFERRQQLPVFGRAFLARALKLAGRAEPAAALAKELADLPLDNTRPVLIREGERGADLGWYWSSDVRTTALVLSALVEITPQHPLVARLADGLLKARVDGRWENTQENVYSLLALAALGRHRMDEADVAVTISVGDKPLAKRAIGRGGAAQIKVPIASLGKGPLRLETDGHTVYYAARLRAWRPLEAAAGQDRGLSIERAYLDPASGQPLGKLKLGQVARVRVTVRAPARLAHVAVVDRLPAGVEPVLERFQRSFKGEDDGPRRSLWWSRWETAWQNQELRDDRVQLFADVLAAGSSQHEYLVRATTAGTFAAPPATAEAMYQPELQARSAGATLEVLR